MHFSTTFYFRITNLKGSLLCGYFNHSSWRIVFHIEGKYISFFMKIYLLNARTCGWRGLRCHRIDDNWKFSLLSKITSSEALDLELQTKVIRRLRRFYNHGSQSATLCFTSSLSRHGCGLLLTDSAPAAAAARVSHALATLRLSLNSLHISLCIILYNDNAMRVF